MANPRRRQFRHWADSPVAPFIPGAIQVGGGQTHRHRSGAVIAKPRHGATVAGFLRSVRGGVSLPISSIRVLTVAWSSVSWAGSQSRSPFRWPTQPSIQTAEGRSGKKAYAPPRYLPVPRDATISRCCPSFDAGLWSHHELLLCRSSDSRVNRPRHIALPVKLHSRLAVRMYSRAEYYRRRGLELRHRAAQITDLNLKEAHKDVARHWLALAERVDWLDRQHNSQRNPMIKKQ